MAMEDLLRPQWGHIVGAYQVATNGSLKGTYMQVPSGTEQSLFTQDHASSYRQKFLDLLTCTPAEVFRSSVVLGRTKRSEGVANAWRRHRLCALLAQHYTRSSGRLANRLLVLFTRERASRERRRAVPRCRTSAGAQSSGLRAQVDLGPVAGAPWWSLLG